MRYEVRPDDAHPRPLTDEQLDDIEQYEIEQIRESKLGLRLNGRLLLAMIREIREHRQLRESIAKVADWYEHFDGDTAARLRGMLRQYYPDTEPAPPKTRYDMIIEGDDDKGSDEP